MNASTVSVRSAGGSDHLSFDTVGLPCFSFIQDWIEYEAQTHQSNMDS